MHELMEHDVNTVFVSLSSPFPWHVASGVLPRRSSREPVAAASPLPRLRVPGMPMKPRRTTRTLQRASIRNAEQPMGGGIEGVMLELLSN